MTAATTGRTRNWRALPTQWSRGFRRRARRWWRWGTGNDAASIERAIAEFTAACNELARAADADQRQRWSRLLSQLGERDVAASLLQSQREQVDGQSHRLAQADHLCLRLERLLAQVQATFDQNLQSLPTTVLDSDSRCAALLEWADALPPHSSLVDIGCGSGRFLHVLSERNPTLRLTGLDPAEPALRSLRPDISRLCGGMLALPVADGAFDAAIAIESLEHSLRPQLAIHEMLRVLKPGGHLFIVDKHRRLQSRCEHEFWERWFDLDEVSRWLSRDANVERAEFLPPDGNAVPPDLFYFWTATKRADRRLRGATR